MPTGWHVPFYFFCMMDKTQALFEKRPVQVAALVIKMLLGVIFVVSAVLKIIDMDSFEIYVYSYHFFSLNFSFLVARAAIILELILGIGLISNCFHKLMWWGSVLMLIGYIGLLGYAAWIGRTDSCHCFGDVLQFNPVQSIAKNFVLLALFAATYYVKGWHFRGQCIALAALVIGCTVAVFVVSPPDNYTSSYDDTEYLRVDAFGEALQDPPLDSLRLYEGKKVVAFFSSGCEFCKKTARKLSLMQSFYGFPESNIVYVFMGSEEGVERFFEESESTRYQYVIYGDLKRLLYVTNGIFPLVVFSDDGQVIHEYGYRNMKEEEVKDFFKP